MGVAELKFHEMDIYPEKEHWLGGVYVPVEHRGKGIASRLIRQAVRIARTLGVPTLYLQTEKLEGGLYASLGWVPVAQANNRGLDVLVMEKLLMKSDQIRPARLANVESHWPVLAESGPSFC